jgi:glycosyltransferase involved in cell wall biosynthesis
VTGDAAKLPRVPSDPPLVTCVIPVRDGARYLGAAIDSVLAQSHRPLEVLVVDDGSTDASAAVAEAYGPPVRVLRRAPAGLPETRNVGVRAARGDFIAMLDADDLLVGDRIARQLERFAARPELELCLGRAESFWEPGLEEEEARYRANDKVYAVYHVGTMLARTALFDRVGLMDAGRPHTDQIDWFSRVRDAGVVVEVLDEVVMRRRMHGTSMSHQPIDHGVYLDLLKARLDQRRERG